MRWRDFEAIDWDDEDDEDGNLVHCLRHGVSERIVDEVLGNAPVRVNGHAVTAELVLVGPDLGNTKWILWFDWSWKRGDWLRPITGRTATDPEIDAWKRGQGRR